ncbi:NADase-type glycan-binding domain-containing protein, partial [Treponema sp.]|uniref:NADase-type glycan-binding domain-containing protein n=1 Tax=Treponema sp. TaxID=166 RepID=UPI00388FE2F9
TVEFAEPVSFDEIQIVNGFVSKDYYLKNNRVKTLRLTQVAKEHFQQKDYTLKDNVQDWQSIKFDLLQTAQTLTLEIRDIYRGSKYDDTCLDDIRLLYNGKVIPFENVGEIKLVQRENSKAKIKLSELDFKIQLLHLGRSIMHRFGDGKLSGLRDIILKSDYDGEVDKIMRFGKDGELEYIAGCTIIDMKEFLNQKNSNKNEYYWMQYIDNLNGKDDDYDYSKYSYAIGYYYPSYWGNNMASFSMSNSRIITIRQIDYVEVTTANLIKLDGNSVYIDGVKYTAIDPALCLDVRLDDGY